LSLNGFDFVDATSRRQHFGDQFVGGLRCNGRRQRDEWQDAE
jgi:hypothetical protein